MCHPMEVWWQRSPVSGKGDPLCHQALTDVDLVPSVQENTLSLFHIRNFFSKVGQANVPDVSMAHQLEIIKLDGVPKVVLLLLLAVLLSLLEKLAERS